MRSIAVVLSGFPRWSETFALPELAALEQRGILGPIFATKKGDASPVQPAAEPFLDRVVYLPEGSAAQQAEWLARQHSLRDVCGIHGYFAHAPAEVARLAAGELGVPFGFSAHAKDVRKVSPAELAERVRAARCVVACNHDVAGTLRDLGAEVSHLRHGVDMKCFVSTQPSSGPVLKLLAVGRLVEKKGFSLLLEACAYLEIPFSLRIVGEGPERARLVEAVRHLGLCDRVDLVGLRTHDELPREYEGCDVVVVPSIVDATGDRDGLPNVVLEAMAAGRPVVGTHVADLASAVRHDVTGLLVRGIEPAALAEAIGRLGRDPARRRELGRNARREVAARFDLERCAAEFSDHLARAYGSDD